MRTALSILIASTALAGCAPGPFKGERPDAPPTAEARPVDRLFAPVAVRIHPFTAIVYDRADKSWHLEARLQLLDALKDVTKAAGDLRVELYEAPVVTTKGTAGKRIELWETALQTLEAHRRHYDRITRTYVFRLRLAHQPNSRLRYRAVVQFTDRAGNRLIGNAVLNVKPPRKPDTP